MCYIYNTRSLALLVFVVVPLFIAAAVSGAEKIFLYYFRGPRPPLLHTLHARQLTHKHACAHRSPASCYRSLDRSPPPSNSRSASSSSSYKTTVLARDMPTRPIACTAAVADHNHTQLYRRRWVDHNNILYYNLIFIIIIKRSACLHRIEWEAQ